MLLRLLAEAVQRNNNKVGKWKCFGLIKYVPFAGLDAIFIK